MEEILKKWLIKWHGEGEEHQVQYYRCRGCLKLVTWNKIRSGGCECGLSKNLSPAVMKFKDKMRVLCLPWTV